MNRIPDSPLLAASVRLPGLAELVALMAGLMALTALSVDIMLPAFPGIADSFTLADANDAQLVVTVYLLGFACGQVLFGPLSDRFGRKPALMLGLAIFVAASVWTILADSFAALLAARAMQGFGCGSPRVVAMAVVRDIHSGRRMAQVMSLVMIVFIMVPMMAPAMGQALMFFGDWSWTFRGLVAAGIVVALWTGLRLPETRPVTLREPLSARWLWRAVRQTATTRVTLGYGIATGLMFGALIGYISSAQQVFVDVYGLGAMFAAVFAGIALAMAAAALTNGRLVMRVGMRRLSHGALIAFAVTAAIGLASALAASGQPPLAVFLLCLLMNSFFSGFLMPNFNALAMEPLGRIAGTAASFIGSATTAMGAVLGGLIGRAFDASVVPLLAGYLALSLAALAVILVTERGRLFGTGS